MAGRLHSGDTRMKLTADDLEGVISWNRKFWPILTDKVLAVALLNFIESRIASNDARSLKLPSHEDWVAALNPLMPCDFKDWHDNHPKDLPLVVAEVIKSLKERADG